MQDQSKLFAKIATVMATVRTLEKTGENKFDRYNYVTADAIAIRIGRVMADVGLAFLPSLVSVETSEYTTQKGGTNFRTVAHFQMTLACTETGATWTSLWSGEAIDRSDKSISKAAVSATKYFLLKTFLLAGGDEEDADAHSPAVERKRSASAPQAAHDVDFGGDTAQGNPWDDDAPADTSKTLSKAQLARLHALGAQIYGDAWDEQRHKLVQAVSKGVAASSKELTPDEADVLIKGMERKLAASAATMPHANGHQPVAA